MAEPAPSVFIPQPVSGAEQSRAEGRARGGSPSLGPAPGTRRLSTLRSFPGICCRPSCILFLLAQAAAWSHGFPALFPHRWTFQACQDLPAMGPPPQLLRWGWALQASPLNSPGTRAPASRFASLGCPSGPAAMPTPTSGYAT